MKAYKAVYTGEIMIEGDPGNFKVFVHNWDLRPCKKVASGVRIDHRSGYVVSHEFPMHPIQLYMVWQQDGSVIPIMETRPILEEGELGHARVFILDQAERYCTFQKKRYGGSVRYAIVNNLFLQYGGVWFHYHFDLSWNHGAGKMICLGEQLTKKVYYKENVLQLFGGPSFENPSQIRLSTRTDEIAFEAEGKHFHFDYKIDSQGFGKWQEVKSSRFSLFPRYCYRSVETTGERMTMNEISPWWCKFISDH